ncbi:MAG: hypothetical protein COV44_08840 [Deltaproteobacteria bacterium CG11_big_fil_rev_8_21_14_0_20_45_16]|nr:MAG: hypothetical protein COV44_08840 [Deltaproteobacteria bacterium CG11_big_fil_rev_8_21_14_0_20_45_16]
MNKMFEKNLEALKQYQLRVYESLEEDIKKFRGHPNGNDGEEFKWVHSKNGLPNLIYTRKSPSYSGLLHDKNIMAEAQKIFERAKLDHPQIVLFFGVGLGYYPQIFFKHRPQQNAVMFIVEKNPQIFLRALCVEDWTDLFQAEGLFLAINRNANGIQEMFDSIYAQYNTVSRVIKALGTPSSLAMDNDYYHEVGRLCLSVRDMSTMNVGNSIDDSFIGFKNIASNIKLSIANPGINHLTDIAKGQVVISVASGPSTDKLWDAIRPYQGKIPIIVCDSSLKKALSKGIEPDFVTAVERVDIVGDYFKGVAIPDRTTLVGPNLLMKSAIEAFKGRRYLYCSTQQQAQGLGLAFLRPFYPGPSSGNLNVSLASLMGAKTVILVGHDLAYGFESKTSHISGTGHAHQETPLEDQELLSSPRVPTQDGKDVVPSTIWWQQFKNQIEVMIGRSPETTWINTSAKGSKIRGTSYLSFEEAIQTHYLQDFDIFEAIKAREPMIGPEIMEAREKNILNRLREAIESMNKWFKAAEQLDAKLENWENEIITAEKSGSPVDLDYLNQALNEVLKVKVEAVNEDKVFYKFAISVFIPAHIAFERGLNEMAPNYTSNYELKRDFLLKHKVYFKIWLKWLPLFVRALEEADGQNNCDAVSEKSVNINCQPSLG